MRVRKVVAVIAIFTALSILVATPRPAHAVSTGVIVVGAIAAYAVFVGGLAWWIFRANPSVSETAPFLPTSANQDLVRTEPPGAIRLAPRCAQNSVNLTLACW